jgi:hypothetical protein
MRIRNPVLRVNKHLSQQEAFVTPRTATDARLEFFGDFSDFRFFSQISEFSQIFWGAGGRGAPNKTTSLGLWHGKNVRILITAARSSQDSSASSGKKLGRWRKVGRKS